MAGNLVAANWKMNGSLERNAELVRRTVEAAAEVDCRIVLCVPFPYLAQVGTLLAGSPVALAAQDVSQHESGAYTGEVSAGMLREMGCTHVIVGHSERRKYHRESDQLVLEKVRSAAAAGLVAIVCVGESLAEREAGETDRVVLGQLESVLAGVDDGLARNLVFAYEPVWAIGSGLAATPAMAQQVHASIRGVLSARLGRDASMVPVLYGGSVSADNASALFAMKDIDGGLVGGASLDASTFLKICAAAAAE